MSAPSIPAKTVWLLLGGYLAAVLLNVHHVALWCLPLAFGTVLWRARYRQAQSGGRRHRWLRFVVVLVLTLSVLIAFHTLNGLQAGATLLVAMAALKLTETRARRDWLIIAGTSLFLVLAACLDAQMLWRLPLYAAELWLMCMALYALGAAANVPSLRVLLRRAGLTLLAAVPFAVLLFLFVPRLAGSLWTLPQEHQAVTGLTEEMDPGSISELSTSGAPVARVRFSDTPPPVEQRYWRGFVLHQFNGRAWRRGRSSYTDPAPLAVDGRPFRYEVSMEPEPYPVLLALELPSGTPKSLPSAHMTDDFQLWNAAGVDRALKYQLESYPSHRNAAALSTAEREWDLNSYGQTHNPRSIELARSLRAQSDSEVAFVDRVLDYLRHGGFRYALEPPLLQRDSIDDLLFNTRTGFCGHYASAFALLMRAGGVPARVVTGYQGGQWNRYGGYLLVRQSDAHAWTEVWLEGMGWERVDPTAVVAPSRLTRGADALSLADAPMSERVLRAAWISNIVQAWQATNAWWQDKFVDFDFTRQRGLLEALGFRQQYLRALALILLAGTSVWLAIVSWGLRPRSRPLPPDALRRSWLQLERKLKQAAPPRAAHEGVIDFAERIGRSRPELASTVNALARRYARLRYGPSASTAELKQFQRAVRLLRPIGPRRLRLGARRSGQRL